MKNKLINFLPPCISEIEEFNEIMNAEDLLLQNIEEKQKDILHENFLETATAYGIKKYEAMFKINPDLLNEDLEFRRLRLKNKRLDRIPFTYRFLCNKLDNLFGEESYKLKLINDIYTLNIEINTFDWSIFNEIADNFRYIIPCNMVLHSVLVNKLNFKIYFGLTTTSGEEVTVYPWIAKSLNSKGTVDIALGEVNGIEQTAIYPRKEII